MDAEISGSIVIPAHNEATTIERCLRGLTAGARSGRFETVVVSNGSLDDTVGVAYRALAGARHCVVDELPTASKVAALRRGDELARTFPRVYLDADVRVDEDTIDSLLQLLRDRAEPTVAAPSLVVHTDRCTPLVRCYYNVWKLLPYVRDGVIGVGIYAVNQAGKDELGSFPDVINDDEWVRRHFPPERRLQSSGQFEIEAARTVRALVRQRARTENGNLVLTEVSTAEAVAERSNGLGDLRILLRRHEIRVVDGVAFLGVVVTARLLAAWRRKRGTSRLWSTDSSSRQ